jgi:calcineurin-like phosphoesterase family protein
MALYFTSDTHFGHDAIRILADRPFASLQAMDDEMVRRWNAVVQPGDTVWHLGDFAHRNSQSLADYRARLNGTIHLVLGNHDARVTGDNAKLFASVQLMAEVNTRAKTIILCHYPLREWDKAWRGAWHLHGHVHGRLDDDAYGFSLDVGVDSHDYRPIGVERIAELLSGRRSPFVKDETRAADSRRRNEMRRQRAQHDSAAGDPATSEGGEP